MLHCDVEFCAAVFHVVMCSCMLCNVVTCYQELLHAVQCCYMLHCVVEFCVGVLYVVMYYSLLCSVVTCCQESLHAAQCC